MQSDLRNLESTSLFYYVPPPAGQHHLLYYPISAGFFDCKPGCSMARSYDSSYLLIVMLTGKMSYETPRSRGVAQAGQALLLDCSLPYSYAAQGKCSFNFVHFDGAQSLELVEEIDTYSTIPMQNRIPVAKPGTSSYSPARSFGRTPSPAVSRTTSPVAPAAKSALPTFTAGDRVRHTTFGEGVILSTKNMGGDVLYEIAFDKVGTKKLMATYARLKKAEQ